MEEQKGNINGICNNPIVTSASNIDVIWSAADALSHFNSENCLPVIGSCQVSSILSTIENHSKEPEIPAENPENFKSIAFNVCNEGTVEHLDKTKEKGDEMVIVERKQLYEEMVFFGCNLCPFICTKDSKISDHINMVHKNQENNKRVKLKCPGCTNVFYHKLSLRSHLIHDHEVCRGDINKIVNGIVYVSTLIKAANKSKDFSEKKLDFLTTDSHISSEDETQELPSLDTQELVAEEETNKEVEEAQISLTVGDSIEKVEEPLLPDTALPTAEAWNIKCRRNSGSKNEEDKKPQKCVVATCAVRMKDVHNMAYHVRSHFSKIFNCLECNEKFSLWRTLQTHLWRHHKINMELYSCDKCDYKTYSLAKLNNVHKLIHGDEKPFLCDFCGKGFKNPKQLRNHKIVHKMKSAELQYQCEVCNRLFGDKRQLKVHMSSVHQKIKPFACNYCGYKAASNGALRLHERQHTGEKPFSCDSCDYTTSDHNSLRRHKSRHSGIKKYKCAHCDYACIQSSTYKTHIKTKHPGLEDEFMFSCHMCQFRTVSKDKFMIHVATHKEKLSSKKVSEMLDNVCRDSAKYTNGIVKSNERVKDNSEYRVSRKEIENSNNSNEQVILPVALISRYDITTNLSISNNDPCLILPVNPSDKTINLVDNIPETNSVVNNSVPPNNVQYLYNGTGVLVELTDGRQKT